MTRHFLRLTDLSPVEARQIVLRASALKNLRDPSFRPFTGKTLAMIFTKSSTRTRVSFEAGMAKFGGHALFLTTATTQLGRDEPISDTARVLSRMCDAIMIRNDSQAQQQELAAHSRVPVVNGLSELHHPCQMLADLQCWFEHRGDPAGKVATWIGDGNNVCHSWIEAASMFGFTLRIAAPKGYEPDAELVRSGGKQVQMVSSPADAARGADLLVTDTWTSMGQEAETQRRLAAFAGFQVDEALMALAKPDAIFMHCLPAHRGEEVSAAIIDGPQSVVWDEAENRLWAQMALLEFLIA
ncbi:ornithine carbamoyltransferase [Panacagrimonas perspica]|uniref:Ornithine carbamoyltransferase n=1 Tax=Panacagrimonas perspica TaxID=381431 RepID=A0A4V3F601_9GAMM|nr:ornithine carbamoyltransferase [Panacagrimonas perspica]TDU30916.1 ornithine carbamoyltransferase [Panacagrimonas perspica]THD01930.1 ornithine carbamoyltransferase [Panacagrimonas perspica]